MSIFTDGKQGEFIATYQHEIMDRYANLSERRDKLSKWRRQRINEPRDKQKNYPFPNSSNVEPPVTSYIAQTLYGNLKNAFGMRDPFWDIKPLRKNDDEMNKQAKVLNKVFDFYSESPTDLNLRAKNRTILYEAGSLGTEFVKIPYIHETTKVVKQTPSGLEEEFDVIKHSGPALIPIPEEDVIYPAGVTDVQRAPWIGTISHLFIHEIEQREQNGYYEEGSTEILEGYLNGNGHDTLEYIRREDKRQSRPEEDETDLLDIYEIFVYCDPDDSGYKRDVIVTIHIDSGTVLRSEYNTMGIRPIEVATYMHVPNSLTGRGVCQMTEGMQDTVSAIYNMRIDADKLVLSPIIKYKKDRGVTPNMAVYPGKMIGVEDQEDLQPMQFGAVNNATVQVEMQAQQMASRNSGMSDTMAGFADSTLKSRDTLGGQNLRLQQGNGMFNSIVEGLEDFYSRIARILFYHFVNNKEKVIEKEEKIGRLTEEEIQILDQALSIPLEEVPLKLVFDVRTRDLEDTKDIQRNNMMMLFTLTNQYFQNNAPLLMQLYGPQGTAMPPEIRSFFFQQFESQTKIMTNMLELLGVNMKDDYVVDIEEYEGKEEQLAMQQMIMSMMQQSGINPNGIQGGAIGPPQGPPAQPQGNMGQGEQGQNPQGEVNDFRR